ncbi:MAG TPA: glutamate-5-semialdehyde dehydrogenase [Candidatus Pelagibacter bacterium]|jgi:glutamate-5-semialdehyde dehydrogenase|nr:glutamate-5-semialdehyde dehydrogenase [Candidatus Pelagibacter bacterium]|tara:strand:+ start:4430 stop:5680 length:1251 start_codon:yes stop_codon:yes gene_type:complete
MKNFMYSIGKKAIIASKNKINSKSKNKVLNQYINLIKKNKKLIIKQNSKDIKLAIKKKLRGNLIDRLTIDQKKLNNICAAIKNVRKLKDPIDVTLGKWKRPNNLLIKRVSIPLGVIGVIFESRPNVASDISSLCFKSGNAVILKGGSEALNSNKILVSLFRKALKANKIDANYVQLIEKKERNYVDFMLSSMSKYIDVIIPRGGKSLVTKVQKFSKIPTIGHLEGICHTYLDKDADLKMATKVVHNAKLRNTSICGATETILIHKKIVKKFCNPILNKLAINNCKIIGDRYLKKYYKGKLFLAKEKDWSTEYLSATVSVKCVKNLESAIEHVNKYGTMHTDSIITKNKKSANKFLKNVKSSIAIHNSSTQFADGGEFGFGGEVGISTNKLPPRGPVGLEQLVSYKYELLGQGQIRK